MKHFKSLLLFSFLVLSVTTSLVSCSSNKDNPTEQGTIARIVNRAKILVGTTGDYRPLSFRKCCQDGTRTIGALKVLRAEDMEKIYSMARG